MNLNIWNWVSLILASIMLVKLCSCNDKSAAKTILLLYNVLLLIAILFAIYIDINTEVIDFAKLII